MMRVLVDKRGYSGLSSKDLYLRLLQQIKPYSKQFILALFCIILFGLSEPMLAYFMKPLIDGTFVERDPVFLAYAPLGLLAIFFVRSVASFSSNVLFSWISGKVVYDLRTQMFAKIIKLPTGYFDATSTGILVNKLTHNVTQVTTAATKVLVTVVRDSISVIGLLGYMLWANWKFTLIVFLMIPVIMGVVQVLAIRLRNLHRRRQAAMGDLTHMLEESIRGQKIVKVFGGEEVEQRRFGKVANWIRRYSFKDKVADAVNIPLIEMIAAIMIALLIYLGTGSGSPMTPGEFISFLTALGLLFPPVKRLTRVNQPLQQGLAGAESVFDLIDQPEEPDVGSTPLPDPVMGALKFSNVYFRYGDDLPDALSGINFEVQPGETVALVGSSGGGKTSIAALLPRLYDPTSGEISLDGIPLNDIALTELRRQISYVGQEAMLFNDTVAANISYGQKKAVGKDVLEQAARAAHALDFIAALPDGFDTQIGEDGTRLSGGQRQRISIARAILKDAPVLILDEATSALDTESERHVQAALDALSKNKTTLVIAHRLSTIEDADRIIVIKQGRIVEMGRHADLIKQQGNYAQLYQNRKNEGSEYAQ